MELQVGVRPEAYIYLVWCRWTFWLVLVSGLNGTAWEIVLLLDM
jgi:hypothetical protein